MKRSRVTFYWWLGLAAVYIVLSFLAPNTKQLENTRLSSLAIHWIDVSVILPEVVILFLAYVGYKNISLYSRKISSNSDGQAFKNIAIGLGVFAYGTLVVLAVMTALKWVAQDHVSFDANYNRISDYAFMLIPLVAFWFISEGASKLAVVGKLKFKDLHYRIMILIIALLGSTYAYTSFHGEKSISALTGARIHFMPDWLTLLTITVPYVFAWAIGLLSVMQILTYRHKIKGLVYRETVNLLANGMGIVLLSYIALEYLTSLADRYKFSQIGWLLFIVYIFLIIIGIGYLFIAIGSKRLQKIEEV